MQYSKATLSQWREQKRKQRRLTKRLAGDNAGILPCHSCSSIPLIHVLYEGVTLVHGAPHYLAVLRKDDLYVGLLDDGCVEVANKDSGIEGAWVIFVGHVAGLGFTSHSPPVALLGHRQRGEGGTGL